VPSIRLGLGIHYVGLAHPAGHVDCARRWGIRVGHGSVGHPIFEYVPDICPLNTRSDVVPETHTSRLQILGAGLLLGTALGVIIPEYVQSPRNQVTAPHAFRAIETLAMAGEMPMPFHSLSGSYLCSLLSNSRLLTNIRVRHL
jgi:hypothetical protein